MRPFSSEDFLNGYRDHLRGVLSHIEPEPNDSQLDLVICYIELRKKGYTGEEATQKLAEILEEVQA